MEQNLWLEYMDLCGLTPEHVDQLERYLDLLLSYNSLQNLTAITDREEALHYHLADSLMVTRFFDFSACRMVADVGTGGGLPGIPLAIKYPNVPFMLIEVVEKKREFLHIVVDELNLENVFISGLDWRTFIRQTDYPIDAVCARASLRPEDLMHMFKPSSPYRHATLIYWAAQGWECSPQEQKLFFKEELYRVGEKNRKYVFFKAA